MVSIVSDGEEIGSWAKIDEKLLLTHMSKIEQIWKNRSKTLVNDT